MTLLRRFTGAVTAACLLGLTVLHGLMSCGIDHADSVSVARGGGHVHLVAHMHMHGAPVMGAGPAHDGSVVASREVPAMDAVNAAADSDGDAGLLCLSGAPCALALMDVQRTRVAHTLRLADRVDGRSDRRPPSRHILPDLPPPRA